MLNWYEAIHMAERRTRPPGIEYRGICVGPDRAQKVRSARDRMMSAHGLFCQTLVVSAFLAALALAGVIFWPQGFGREVLFWPISGWTILLSVAAGAASGVFGVVAAAYLFLTDLRLRGLHHATWALLWTLFLSAALLVGLLGMPKAISGDVDRLLGPP